MRTIAFCALLAGCATSPTETTDEQAIHHNPDPVGLSLFVRDGAAPAINLVGNTPRFLQEIDVVDSVVTSTDQGSAPALGLLPGVDWRGLHFIEEDWRAPGDGTWTRQRFYRGARWMERRSSFELQPLDKHGHPVGDKIVFDAGRDDHWNPQRDDGFVRRFDVRQIVKGCQAQGDCSNATAYEVQALAQGRQAQHLDAAREIPAEATNLRLHWTAGTPDRTIAVTHSPTGAIGYGFVPKLQILTPPANGRFYQPGDTLSVRVGFFDGEGHQLNTSGSLPTYAQTLAGQANGLRYWDPTLDATLYYALKHREANMILQLSGPANAVHTPAETTDLGQFFGPQVTIATVETDGFSAAGVEIPFLPSVLGGFQDPSQWNLPVSDVQQIQIAADARPGTYTLTIKARRDWGGEALNRGATIELQVGQTTVTAFSPSVGHCENCHNDRAELAVVNHGIGDRRSCAGCHSPLAFEPDNALDIRSHSIHSRSERFPGNFQHCETCHLTPPTGPARGAFIGDPD
jgi:hypothetical protein